MFKKILGIGFDDNRQTQLNLDPLDIIGGDKIGQKLLKFSRPDLVTGWAADLSAVTKKSQSQILEEVILQQFMPRNRTLQAYVDTLYSEKGTVNENVSETVRGLLSLRTGGNFRNEDADFRFLATLVEGRIVGHHIWYEGSRYPKGAVDPMYHLMSNFTSCRDALLDIIESALEAIEHPEDSVYCEKREHQEEHFLTKIAELQKENPNAAKLYIQRLNKEIHDSFDHWINLWEIEKGSGAFREPIHNFIAPVLKYWDNGLCEFRGAYTVLYDAVGFALYESGKEIFDIKDRLQVLNFINYLDQTGTVGEYIFD